MVFIIKNVQLSRQSPALFTQAYENEIGENAPATNKIIMQGLMEKEEFKSKENLICLPMENAFHFCSSVCQVCLFVMLWT